MYLLKDNFQNKGNSHDFHTDITHVLKDLFYSHDIKELGRYYNQFKAKVKTAQIYVEKKNAGM